METLGLNNHAASLALQEKQEEAAAYLQHALASLRDNVDLVNNDKTTATACGPDGSSDMSICDSFPACCQQHEEEEEAMITVAPAAELFVPGRSRRRRFEGAFEFYDNIFQMSVVDETKFGCSRQSQKLQHFMLAIISKLFSLCFLMTITTR